jgi:dihydropteroate synthase
MGILNVTPDSFSDGGDFVSVAAALRRAREMVDEGVDIIDVGGESTRPGAAPVGEDEELSRVIPVIEGIAGEIPVPLSVDTSKPRVMTEAVAAGAGLINDVWALRAPGALEAAVEARVPVCLMHMQGEPRSMQAAPRYSDVTREVRDFLRGRIKACADAGIPAERLLVDPGLGFGKTLAHNIALLRNLGAISELGVPVLVGASRKSMLGALLDAPLDQRLYGGLAAAVLAVVQGARLIRTHDVKPTVDTLKVAAAILGFGE